MGTAVLAAAFALGTLGAADVSAPPGAKPTRDFSQAKVGRHFVFHEITLNYKGDGSIFDQSCRSVDKEVISKSKSQLKLKVRAASAKKPKTETVPLKAPDKKRKGEKVVGQETLEVAEQRFECEVVEWHEKNITYKEWRSFSFPFTVKKTCNDVVVSELTDIH